MLNQNIATALMIGPFVDSSDGDTNMSGLTIGYSAVFLSKNHAPHVAQDAASTDVATYASAGYYSCVVAASNLNTPGELEVKTHITSALLTRNFFEVVNSGYYSWKASGVFPASVITAAVLATDSIGADAIAGTAVDDIQSGLNDITQANVQSAVSAAVEAYDPPTKAELDSGLAGLNDITQTNVQSAVSAAVESYAPLKSASATTAVRTAVFDAQRADYSTSGSYGELYAAILTVVVSGGGSTSSFDGKNLTEKVANDMYNGSIIKFVGCSLSGQAVSISDFASANARFTVTTMTAAPASGDRGLLY